MMIDARRAVRNALAHFEPGDRILLAVSGGADSLLLAAATNLEAIKVGIQLNALVVDHQLQNGSGEVALEAQKKIIELGITETNISQVLVNEKVGNGGLEAAARRARYEALDAEADRIGAVAIFLGHTEDDLAETVLLGLARGSGTRSLSGMAFQVGRYVRPFLELTRAQVLAACKESGIEYWSDPQNEELSFARVRVRNEILPKMEKEIGPGISKALARTRADAGMRVGARRRARCSEQQAGDHRPKSFQHGDRASEIPRSAEHERCGVGRFRRATPDDVHVLHMAGTVLAAEVQAVEADGHVLFEDEALRATRAE